MPTIIVVSDETLATFHHPAVDLTTGHVIELSPTADTPVQLDMEFEEEVAWKTSPKAKL